MSGLIESIDHLGLGLMCTVLVLLLRLRLLLSWAWSFLFDLGVLPSKKTTLKSCLFTGIPMGIRGLPLPEILTHGLQ